MGNHTMGSGRTLPNPATPIYGAALPNKELGNERAVNTQCGPGGSRTVMPAGGQVSTALWLERSVRLGEVLTIAASEPIKQRRLTNARSQISRPRSREADR